MLKKRVLAGFVAAMMVCTIMPQNVFANENRKEFANGLEQQVIEENGESSYEIDNNQSKNIVDDNKKQIENESKNVESNKKLDGELIQEKSISFDESKTDSKIDNKQSIESKNEMESKSASAVMQGVLAEGDVLCEKKDFKDGTVDNEAKNNLDNGTAYRRNFLSNSGQNRFNNPLSSLECKNIVAKLTALEKMSSSTKYVRINVSGYGITLYNISETIGWIFNSHPELFFYKEKYSYRYTGKDVLEITFSLENTVGEIQRQKSIIDKQVNQFDQLVEPNMTSEELVLLAHDFIAANTAYDYKGVLSGNLDQSVFDIYGVFGEKVAVCQGYALAAEYLLNRHGIKCGVASSKTANHAWNVVKIDDNWYHVDATWDDPVYDNLGTVKHEFLLISQEKLLEKENCDNRKDFITSVKNDYYQNTLGNSFDEEYWMDSAAYIHQYNGKQYYMDKDTFQLKVYDKNSASSSIVLDDKAFGKKIIWKHKTDSNRYWKGNFSKVIGYKNYLYFSTPNEIYKLDLYAEKSAPVKVFQTTQNSIYGIGEFNNTIMYVLKDSPSNNEDIYENKKIHGTNISVGCNTKITKLETGDGEFTVTFRPVTFYNDSGNPIKMKYRVYYRIYNANKYSYVDSEKNQVKISGLHRNYLHYVKVMPFYEDFSGKIIKGDLSKTEKLVTNQVNLYIPKGKIVDLNYTDKYDTVKIETIFPVLKGGNIYCQLAYKKTTDKEYKVKSFKGVNLTLSGLKKNTAYRVGVRYVYTDNITGKKAISRYSTTLTFKTKDR